MTPSDAEGSGERCRIGARHGGRHGERADPLRAFFAGDVGGGDDGAGRGAAGAHDQAGAFVLDLAVLEAGIRDRLLHGDIVPGGTVAHEAADPAVDGAVEVEMRFAMDLAAEAELGIIIGLDDSRLCFPQRGGAPPGCCCRCLTRYPCRSRQRVSSHHEPFRISGRARLRVWREQADPQLARGIYVLAVGLDDAIRDAEIELS